MSEHVFEMPSCGPACVVFLINYLLRNGIVPPARGPAGGFPKTENVSSSKNGERMFLDLRGRCGGRDRRFLPYRATMLTPMVLLTTVSCSTLSIDLAECDLSSGLVTEEQVLPPREQPRPKVRREQATTERCSKRAGALQGISGLAGATKRPVVGSPAPGAGRRARHWPQPADGASGVPWPACSPWQSIPSWRRRLRPSGSCRSDRPQT